MAGRFNPSQSIPDLDDEDFARSIIARFNRATMPTAGCESEYDVSKTMVVFSCRRSQLLAPVYDASKIFTGANVRWHFSFEHLGRIAPRMHGKELTAGDVVLLIHSIYSYVKNGETNLRFGIYAVVLLARHDTKQRLDAEDHRNPNMF